jgi:hypothetical protein
MVTAATVFRDFVTDGVPSSGRNKPKKSEIRAWGAAIEAAIDAADGGFTLDAVPGFDADNAHIALQAIADQTSGKESLHIHFLAKDYTFKTSVTFNVRNVSITAEIGHKLIATNGIAAESAAFEFGTQAGLEPTGTMRQQITNPSLSVAAKSCQVANAGAFSRGDIAGIVSGSGSSSGEYWYGISGQNGFGRARKCEMVEIERVDYVSNTIYFMAPLLDSYDCTAHVVEIRRFDMQGERFVAQDLNWFGAGGGNTHDDVSEPSSGPRAINVWGFRDVTYRGGKLRNFGRFGAMFYNCLSGTLSGVDADGWAAEDQSNFKPDNPAYRSVWFTGFFICGGTDWVVSGNNYRNMRRLCDIDRGPWFPRNVTFSHNTADNCEYVMSGHVGEKIAYIGNIGVRCRFGLMTRARHTKAIGNMIQCERYGMQAGPIAGTGIVWDVNTARAGTLEFVDNTVEVSSGEYFATYMSFDRLLIVDNTCFGSLDTNGRHGFNIQAKYMRDLTIENNLIDMSLAGQTGSLGDCIFVGDGDQGSGGVLEVQDGVSIKGNDLRGGSTGIRIRGVSKDNGTTLGSRSKNMEIGPNKHVNHALRDIRFEQGVYDGARIRVIGGQSFGSRASWPRVSLGSDMRRWSEVPLSDPAPTEKIDGSFIGLINPTHDVSLAQVAFTTHRKGQKYWNVDPGASQPTLYLVGQDGTRGTLSGVTGNIASGSSAMTVNDATNIFVGCYLSIAGAGAAGAALVARVNQVVGSAVTLDVNASTSVSGAAVTFRNSSILPVAAA